jgi:signal transduction histidine kinase
MTPHRRLRLWPTSLYGQILFVVAVALFVAQSFNAYMLFAGSRGRAIVEASTMLVNRVSSQIERQRDFGETDPMPPKEGRKGFRRPPPVSITLDNSPLIIQQFDDQNELATRATEFLAQSDVGLRSVRLSVGPLAALPHNLRDPQIKRMEATSFRKPDRPRATQAVLFSAKMADGKWINAAGLVRPNEAGSILALLLQTLTLYIAVMVPLALVARRIAKPLARLTERFQRVGLNEEIAPLSSEGPTDIRHLIDAFNNMQARVSGLLGEKDVMLGAIGHDLKTPLAALRVRIESVDDDTERNKMADTIDEMVTILDDILTLARLGKSGEDMQRTDIGALVEAIAEEQAGATVTDNGQRHILPVRPVLLRRALRNLIGNAVTYGKTATISVKETSNHISILIDDDGPGLSAENMDAMFEPFARAETSRSRSTGGAGLGLTIARAIARSHNGDVRLENRESGGLRAILDLPKTA